MADCDIEQGANARKVPREEEPKEEAPQTKRVKTNGPDEGEEKKSFSGFGFAGFGGGFAALKSDAAPSFGAPAGGFGALAEKGPFSGGFFAAKEESFGAKQDETEDAEEKEKDDEEPPANGEEEETCIAKYRAKLFELVKSDEGDLPAWRERGIGQLRILEARDDPTKHRAVMRREQTHSLLLNVNLDSVTLAKHTESAIRLIQATPTSSATFLLRVKTSDDRNALFTSLSTTSSRTSEVAEVAEPSDDLKTNGAAAATKTADDDDGDEYNPADAVPSS